MMQDDSTYFKKSDEFEQIRRLCSELTKANKRKHKEIHVSSDDDSIEIHQERHKRKDYYRSNSKELYDMTFYYKRSKKYMKERRLRKALKYINVALQLCSQNDIFLCKLYERRGKIYSLLDEPKCSLRGFLDWEKAHMIDRSNQDVRKNISNVLFIGANMYYNRGYHDKALAAAQVAFNLYEDNKKAYALLKLIKEQFEESQQKQLATKQVYAKKMSYHWKYKVKKSPEKRAQNKNEYKQAKLDEAKHFTDLAIIEYRMDNFPRALILINKALKSYPEDQCSDNLYMKLYSIKQQIVSNMNELSAVPVIDTTARSAVVELPELNGCELPPIETLAIQISESHDGNPALVNIKKLVSKEIEIDDFISAGMIPDLISNLRVVNDIHLQLESCKALNMITDGTSLQVQAVVDAGAIPNFIDLIVSPNAQIAEQAISALRNIVGKFPETKELVEAIYPLLSAVKSNISESLKCQIMCILTKLCELKNIKALKECIPVFAAYINTPDSQTIKNICWAVAHLTEDTDIIEKVINSSILNRLIELLQESEVSFINPCLKAIENIVSGEEYQAQAVIDAGIWKPLKLLIVCDDANVVKAVCSIISKITAKSVQQIDTVVNSGIMNFVIGMLYQNNLETQKEAACLIRNFTIKGTEKQILDLVPAGLLTLSCDILSHNDAKILLILLDILRNILKAAQTIKRLESACIYIKLRGGVKKLKDLLNHANGDIYKVAQEIIDTYFPDEEEIKESALKEETVSCDIITLDDDTDSFPEVMEKDENCQRSCTFSEPINSLSAFNCKS